MSNTNQNPTKEKALTKYDRKMQARKEAEARDKHSLFVSRIIGVLVSVAIIAIIIAIPVVKIINSNREYIRVGNHKVTEVEYNFYYNYYTAYSRQLYIYYGLLDPSKSLDTQMYDENTSFAQYFESSALRSIAQSFILQDDAKQRGLTYDVSAEYNSFYSSLKQGAETNNMSENDYLKAYYGVNATKSNIKSALKGILIGDKHYEYLIEQNAPTSEEIETYYTEHKNEYDTVDYYVFESLSDIKDNATEDERIAALNIALNNAADMEAEFNNGADFGELCKKYAADSQKSMYDKDSSYKKSTTIGNLNTSLAAWLTNETRVENDTTVIANEENDSYFLIVFKGKQRPDTATDTMKHDIAANRIIDFLNSVNSQYQIIDEAHNLIITSNASVEDYSDLKK